MWAISKINKSDNMNRMTEKDFTQKKYADLIECLAAHYPTFGIVGYSLAHRSRRLPENYFIVRHDVDGNIRNALDMAQIDARNGIRSTFYFRVKPLLFNPDIIRKIDALGHEIGYHYEVLSDTKGDMKKARLLFEANLKKVRSLAPVETVCMHGRSLSPHNNLDFWQKYVLAEFDLIAEPYLTIDYTDKYYFSDTSRCWDNYKYNLRDIVKSKGSRGVKTTDDLVAFLKTAGPKKGAILTHSNFWTNGWLHWWGNRCLFFALNQIKRFKKKRSGHKKNESVDRKAI
jgi:hypothetical protein